MEHTDIIEQLTNFGWREDALSGLRNGKLFPRLQMLVRDHDENALHQAINYLDDQDPKTFFDGAGTKDSKDELEVAELQNIFRGMRTMLRLAVSAIRIPETPNYLDQIAWTDRLDDEEIAAITQ
ncbi:MAG: hypothetical protein ACRERV_05125, partial [Methylococcales bacterium]